MAQHHTGFPEWDREYLPVSEDIIDWRPLGELIKARRYVRSTSRRRALRPPACAVTAAAPAARRWRIDSEARGFTAASCGAGYRVAGSILL